MVVVGIVGILACVSYSGFSSQLQREKATAAANQLMGHLKEAKMLAMEKHESHTVDANETMYIVYRDASNLYTLDDSESIIHKVDLAKDFLGVKLSVSVIPFRFDTKGMPKKPSPGAFLGTTFTLTMAGKRQCTLTIANSGRIDVTSCSDL